MFGIRRDLFRIRSVFGRNSFVRVGSKIAFCRRTSVSPSRTDIFFGLVIRGIGSGIRHVIFLVIFIFGIFVRHIGYASRHTTRHVFFFDLGMSGIALYASVIECHDSRAEGIDEHLLMSNDDNGYSRLIYQAKHVHDLSRHFRVDISRRFVRDDHFRAVYDRSRKRDPLLFSARKLRRKRFFLSGQSDDLHDRRDPCFDLVFASSDRSHCERDVVKHIHCRNEPEILKNDAESSSVFRDLPVGQIFGVYTVNDDFSARRNILRCQKADDR